MAPTAPPPVFPGQDRRSTHSPPRNPPPMGCAGGAWRAGSSSRSPTQSARIEHPRLPEDVLMIVFSKLEIPDLVRAGAVCTSWRTAYTTLRDLGKHKQSQTPCLLYTSESAGDSVACLYSLVEKRVYRLTLPEPPIRRRFIVGSSLGFLVTVDERSEMHLVNPITGEQIALPLVTTMAQVKPICDDSGAVHEYEYSMNVWNPEESITSIYAPCELREFFHIKAFLFYDASTGSFIVALIHKPAGQLSFARVGDDKWTWLPGHSSYLDCTYKDGLLYAVTIVEIHAFDLSDPAVMTVVIDDLHGVNLQLDAGYIVQAPWGDLLIVSRLRDIENRDDEDALPKIKLDRVDVCTMRLVEN